MAPKALPTTIAWLLLCLVAAASAGPVVRAADTAQDADLRSLDPARHIEFLSTHGSRYTGYPGCTEAEKYIVQQFKDIGLANVEEIPFQVVVPIVPTDDRWGKKVTPEEAARRSPTGGTLTVAGREVPLYCMMPNYVRTPMTGEKGITGNLVWAGDGYLADFNGKDIDGSIVLMEFNSFSRWLNAAKLGAKAVIFLEPDSPFRNDAELKYNELPLPVPRYYLRRSDLPMLAAALRGGQPADLDFAAARQTLDGLGEKPVPANVRAVMRWEEATVMRVTGEIPGTDPLLAGQVLVVYAYYDSVSVVAALSPGAESACGIAALLETAKYLSEHPPRRKVKFMAAPGHYQALSGARDYALKTMYPRRNTADKDAKQGTGEPYFFIGLDLSSRRNSLGSFYKGNFYDELSTTGGNNEVELQRAYSEFSGVLVDWMDDLTSKGAPAQSLTFQSGIVPQQGRDWRSLLPDLVAFDSEVITFCGYPAITLATTGDPRNSVNTPLDTFEDMKPFLDNVRRQAISCAYLIKQTADIPVLPVQRADVWKNHLAASIFGFSIELSLQAYMPKVALPNAVAACSMLAPDLTTKSKTMMGVDTYGYYLSNVQGLFEVFGLARAKNYKLDGFLLAPTNGVPVKLAQSLPQVVPATDKDREADWSVRETDLRLNFFRAVSTTIFDLTDPLSLRTLSMSTAREGEANSELQYLVSFVGQGDNPVAIFYTERDRNVKFLLAASAVSYEGLLLNFKRQPEGAANQKREETGLGYRAVEGENFIYRTGLRIAQDMHDMDRYRLSRLDASGVTKTGDMEVFERAGTHVEAASRAMDQRRYDDAYFNIGMARGLEGRIYPDIRDSRTDVVKGVIFYFALLLPFVIFAERLLINYVEIRHKLVAIAALFIVSYLVLRVVHPAFSLSQTPVIILIGFFMLVAAIFTIWYLLGKFGIVMESVRQKVDMIHRADVARASATMAAFVLGISNMRKRKVRTGLTAVTLILLTFTILSFTSFETMPARMLEYTSPKRAPYVGVLLRGLGWGSLSEFVTYDMADFFSVQGMRAAPRSWFVNRKPTEELQIEITRDDVPGTEAVANAVLGLSPEEKYFSGINSDQYLRGRVVRPQDGRLALRLHRALPDEAEPAHRGQ